MNFKIIVMKTQSFFALVFTVFLFASCSKTESVSQCYHENLFVYDNSPEHNIVYRIPAIATTSNGNIIAVSDYRDCGADIGFGLVSLHYKVSHDNGKTWGEEKILAQGHEGKYGLGEDNDLEAGFGDAAVVADRESSKVLILSCCGNVSYPDATFSHHQGIARFYSTDNGETFSNYEDISGAIYDMFKETGIDLASMFVGSGRIFQSKTVKLGEYYRIYAACLLRTQIERGLNYVIYSDDFGQNWNILGHTATPAVTGGDEPKVEELPNGDILISSRTAGRIFNIFKFSKEKEGNGEWMNQAVSNKENNGIIEEGNECNGEIMILPVVRNSDQKKMYLALQSVPRGPEVRINVGIFYKELETAEDYASPEAFAKDWDGFYLCSELPSAYSTMTLQKNNLLGFLYEETTFGPAYTIVYKSLSLETITNNSYSLCLR